MTCSVAWQLPQVVDVGQVTQAPDDDTAPGIGPLFQIPLDVPVFSADGTHEDPKQAPPVQQQMPAGAPRAEGTRYPPRRISSANDMVSAC